jgi:hypothetical protein
MVALIAGTFKVCFRIPQSQTQLTRDRKSVLYPLLRRHTIPLPSRNPPVVGSTRELSQIGQWGYLKGHIK